MKNNKGRSENYPSEHYAWFVIGILFLVTLFSQLDRQLPALLVQPIKAQFAISDTAFSLLQGYAFAIVYTLAGIPLGRMVDRTHRRNLILFGLVFWSAMTVASGLAQSFKHLLLCRIGVGIGEAVLAPAAYSIIADYFPQRKRGRALGIYYVSLAIGSGASLLLGGLIFKFVGASGITLPYIGELSQWRAAFVVAGFPGFIIAATLLLVREPNRQETTDVNLGVKTGSIREFLTYLRVNVSVYSRILTYPATIAVVGYGALAWAPALFERRFSMERADIGITLGILIAVSGLVGTLLSAFLSDRWANRNVPAARLRVTLVGWILILPMAIIWPLSPTPKLALISLGLLVAGAAVAQAAAPAIVQEVTPNRMRGQAIAIYLLIGGLLGIGLGPTLVALVTDHLFGQEGSLPYALAFACGPVAFLGAILCFTGLKPYARMENANSVIPTK